MISRRQFTTMMLLGLPIAAEQLRSSPRRTLRAGSAAPQKKGALSSAVHFLVFGDWGTLSPVQSQVARAMEKFADTHRATNPLRFVLNTGDSFYEVGVKDVHDPQW